MKLWLSVEAFAYFGIMKLIVGEIFVALSENVISVCIIFVLVFNACCL